MLPEATHDGVDLTATICGVRLSGPLMLASGGLGESAASLARFQTLECGAVITRTLRQTVPPGREVFPSPHLALGPRRSWVLNCEWGNLCGLDYWIDEGIPDAASRGPVIASVSGRDLADCLQVCRRLRPSPAVMLEINFSCSHSGRIYGRINDDPRHVAAVVAAAKRIAGKLVIAKLGWSPALASVALAAEEAGADAITVTNSIGPGLDIDIITGEPRLGISGGFGGMSGPAIFPIALECVSQVAGAVSVPTIGVGGVSKAEDAIKMIMVGAACVQIYTSALIRGPRVFRHILSGIGAFLHQQGYHSLDDIRGLATPSLHRPSQLGKRLPVVDAGRCQPCGACARICPADAIQVDRVASVDGEICTGCGICVDACPPQFNALSLADACG
jgi:dihydroorotate dehydrogenase (NAD+) catalytic subunit